MMSNNELSIDDFIRRSSELKSIKDVDSLRKDAIETENLYRELFARKRESWEIPEIEDNYHFLLDVFATTDCFKCLPKFENDATPRCFELDKRLAAGVLGIVPTQSEFDMSWECLTEGLLRFINWENVCAAGGAVAGCVARLPPQVSEAEGGISEQCILRRKYFHDTFLPGSDIDLFLHGLNEAQAEKKLLEIYDAVQRANPYKVRAFRSAHAITLVSQYPFRHVQIILRLYNSPSEVLMGFDVDSCAIGYDGSKVLACPRTAMSTMTQSNLVDMSRRSPSYEMRLSKYATRGFEVIVPSLNRDRVDPFLYEKRFDQAKGLSRLLLLEKLRTPEERLRYKLEGQLKSKGSWNYSQERRLRKLQNDQWSLNRAEGIEGIIPPPSTGNAEMSNYSTIFLPWGPSWTAEKCEQQALMKDKALNETEFTSDGRVIERRRSFKIHLCAVGTMKEVIADPFPDDPPIPDNIPSEELESLVRGKLTWLVDNPGRQQIGSFHPITDEDWTEGAYFTHVTEALTRATVINDVDEIAMLLSQEEAKGSGALQALFTSKDFLGRSSLHLATLSHSVEACRLLLDHPLADSDYLQARLPDGRMSLHLAAMNGDQDIMKLILEKRRNFTAQMTPSPDKAEEENLIEALDIDGADWETKLNSLQYAIALGHVEIVRTLLNHGANARKIAVHKDKNKSFSTMTLLAKYALECGEVGFSNIQPILELLLGSGASFAQVDTTGKTCWHYLALSKSQTSFSALETFLAVAKSCKIDKKVLALDVLDNDMSTALHIATKVGNEKVIDALLQNGAMSFFSEEDWEKRQERARGVLGHPSHHYYHHRNAINDDKRCPFLLATCSVDVPSISVFLRHDKSFANFTVDLPRTFFLTSQSGGHYGSYYGSNNTPKIGSRPIDLLERARSILTDHTLHNNRINQSKNIEESIKVRKERLEQAKTFYDKILKIDNTSKYEMFVLSIAVTREKEQLKKLEESKEKVDNPEEEEEKKRDKEEAIKRINDAYLIIKDAGGQPHPKRDTEIEGKNPDSMQNSRTYMGHNTSHIENKLDDPFGYRDLENNYGHNLVESTKKKMHDLMIDTSNGNMEGLKDKVKFTRVCFYNNITLTTPLFLAVDDGKIDAIGIIFEATTKQLLCYVKEQRSLFLEKRAKEEKDLNEANIKDKVRRLNNFDIAAGEMPKSEGPTPDEIRSKLEAAEEAALAQTSLPEQTADKEDKWETLEVPASSSVYPEKMLLHRSTLFPEEPLLELKRRMKTMCPNLSEEWVNKEVKLNPIELAVIRNDLEIATELLSRAEETSLKLSKDLGWDCEIDEEDDMVNLPYSNSFTELKYELIHNQNSDLENMTLIHLAVMMNNVAILRLVLSFVREFALPQSTVKFWEKEVGKGFLSGFNSHNHTAILHFALNTGCDIIAKALMSGELDDPLLSWIVDKPYKAEKKKYASHVSYQIEGVVTTANWMSKHVFESNITKNELIKRLARPAVFDALGRTALFYAPTRLIPEVVDSAVKATLSAESCISLADAKSAFLEAKSTNGFTALMAAATCGEVNKVKSLLNVGAKCSTRTDDKREWNAIHMAIVPTENRKKCWKKAKDIIKIILDSATETELDDLLLCPNSEHTPLMLAASSNADKAIIALLAQKTALRALEGLARCDNDMNTTLHLLVKKAINNPLNEKEEIERIKVFLNQPNVPKGLGPTVENARGMTPTEISLESIIAVWSSTTSNFDKPVRRVFSYNCSLPPRMQSSVEVESGAEGFPSLNRQLLLLLIDAESKSRNSRLQISFEGAQSAAQSGSAAVSENKSHFGACQVQESVSYSKPHPFG